MGYGWLYLLRAQLFQEDTTHQFWRKCDDWLDFLIRYEQIECKLDNNNDISYFCYLPENRPFRRLKRELIDDQGIIGDGEDIAVIGLCGDAAHYHSGGKCSPCSSIAVDLGQCDSCLSPTVCVAASCDSGFYWSNVTGLCLSCSELPIGGGTCTECSSTECSTAVCSPGHGHDGMGSCPPCNSVAVENGVCKECSSSTSCSEVSCSERFFYIR